MEKKKKNIKQEKNDTKSEHSVLGPYCLHMDFYIKLYSALYDTFYTTAIYTVFFVMRKYIFSSKTIARFLYCFGTGPLPIEMNNTRFLCMFVGNFGGIVTPSFSPVEEIRYK